MLDQTLGRVGVGRVQLVSGSLLPAAIPIGKPVRADCRRRPSLAHLQRMESTRRGPDGPVSRQIRQWVRFTFVLLNVYRALLTPGLGLVINRNEEKTEEQDPPTCPGCSRPMTLRVNRACGNLFWGCSHFPKCTATRKHQPDSGESRDEQITLTKLNLMKKDELPFLLRAHGEDVTGLTVVEMREMARRVLNLVPSARANKDKYKNLGKKKKLELAEMAIELGIKITIDGSRVHNAVGWEMTRDALEAAVRTNLRVKATPAEAGPGDPVDREKTAGRTAAPSRAGPSRGPTDRAEAGPGDPADWYDISQPSGMEVSTESEEEGPISAARRRK